MVSSLSSSMLSRRPVSEHVFLLINQLFEEIREYETFFDPHHVPYFPIRTPRKARMNHPAIVIEKGVHHFRKDRV